MDRSENDNSLPSIHAFSTFFYPKVTKQGHSGVKRWTRKVDLFSLDRVLFPIHLGVHWTFAAALIKEKEVVYMDSMGDSNVQCQKVLLQYLRDEHQLRKKSPLPDGWTTRSMSGEIPQQNNSSDCGVFCCCWCCSSSTWPTVITLGWELRFLRMWLDLPEPPC